MTYILIECYTADGFAKMLNENSVYGFKPAGPLHTTFDGQQIVYSMLLSKPLKTKENEN